MNKIIFAFLCSLFFISCKKDKEIKPTANVVTFNTLDLFKLKTGNFWIYEVENIPEDPTNQFHNFSIDSTVIEGDTFIRGRIFKKTKTFNNGDDFGFNFYNDSLGNLINNKGEILFPSNIFNVPYNFQSLVLSNDTFFKSFDIMDGILKNVLVPAGKFKSLNRARLFTFFNPKFERQTVTSFSPGTGIIYKENFFIGSKKSIIISRLLRFKID